MKKVTFTAASGASRGRTDTDFSVTDEVSLFFASCKVDDVATVQTLLDAHASIIRQERKGTTPLHVAARAGADRVVQAIVKADPEITLQRDKAGFSAFARAAEAGKLSVLRILMDARPNSHKDRDFAMFTPLHRAAGNGHREACVFLLDHGALINDTDHKSTETPLFHACRSGAASVVELLLSRGADVNAVNDSYSTCIFTCIQSLKEQIGKSLEVLDALLKHGAKTDIQNNFFQTPLSLAVEIRCREAVTKLLHAGAAPDYAPYARPSPFMDVLVNNKREMIQAFEEGLGRSVVVDKLCQISAVLDPSYIVGKHLHVLGFGEGYCVEAYRPVLGLFGPLTHTIRLTETGEEKSMVLDRDGVPGQRFYLVPDQNFERPLDLTIRGIIDDDDFD